MNTLLQESEENQSTKNFAWLIYCLNVLIFTRADTYINGYLDGHIFLVHVNITSEWELN